MFLLISNLCSKPSRRGVKLERRVMNIIVSLEFNWLATELALCKLESIVFNWSSWDFRLEKTVIWLALICISNQEILLFVDEIVENINCITFWIFCFWRIVSLMDDLISWIKLSDSILNPSFSTRLSILKTGNNDMCSYVFCLLLYFI